MHNANDNDELRVQITWIACATGKADPLRVGIRLHAIADQLHDQKTRMKEGRYWWALSPDQAVIRCLDNETHCVVEWSAIDEENEWVIEWLRGAMKLVRRKMI
jgi:hypothetical protein